MKTPSPFAEIQRLQDEQREGWVPETPFEGSTQYDLAEKDAKIVEQAAQIVALRRMLDHIATKTHCAAMAGPAAIPTLEQVWTEFDLISIQASVILSTPAPPVVPLEDVKPLLDALKIIAANPGASHGPSCLYDSGPIATGAIAKFNAKHPQP